MARRTAARPTATSANTGAAQVTPARRPELRLPPPSPWPGAELEPDGDYDGLEFRDADLSGHDGAGARFMDCALTGCALDETALGRARFLDTVLTGVRGVGTNLAESTFRDVEVLDPRLGGTQLHGAVLERVVIRGGKIDYLNLREARLKDVVFDNCVLVEPDFAGAHLERVEFTDSALRGADFGGTTLKDVDLRGASPLDITRGLDRLRGSAITPAQLLDLAPALAAELGIKVLP